MKATVAIMAGLLACPVSLSAGRETPAFRATVAIREEELARLQGFAAFKLPPDLVPDAGVRVLDGGGRDVPAGVLENAGSGKAMVFFGIGSGGDYTVLGGTRPAADSAAHDFPPPGIVLLDDFLPPGTRTSGFWNWRRAPVLTGRFSHDGHGPGASRHSFFLARGEPVRGKGELVQYLFIDPGAPPREIMIGVTTERRGRRGEKTFFSWGEDHFHWRDISRQTLGELPPAGRWVRLSVPLALLPERAERVVEIGFYYYGGRVSWGRTSLGEVPARAEIVRWEEEGRAVSAFFTVGRQGPFSVAGRVFHVVSLDASASAGARGFNWQAGGRALEGPRVSFTTAAEEKTVAVRLETSGDGPSRAVTERDIVLPETPARELKLPAHVPPYQNLVAPGDEFMLSLRLSSPADEPLPVTVRFAGESRPLELLPGPANSETAHFFLTIGPDRAQHSLQVLAGDRTLLEMLFVFAPLDLIGPVAAEGPYLKDAEGRHLVGVVPEFNLPAPVPAAGPEALVFLVGDYPDELPGELRRLLAEKGVSVTVEGFSPKGGSAARPGLEQFLFLRDRLRFFPPYRPDMVFFFPCLAGMRAGVPADEWRRGTEAALQVLARHGVPLVLFTPFPPPPRADFFQPYRGAVREIAADRGGFLVDLYDLYTARADWEKFFLAAPGVYRELPGAGGSALLAERLAELFSPGPP